MRPNWFGPHTKNYAVLHAMQNGSIAVVQRPDDSDGGIVAVRRAYQIVAAMALDSAAVTFGFKGGAA